MITRPGFSHLKSNPLKSSKAHPSLPLLAQHRVTSPLKWTESHRQCVMRTSVWSTLIRARKFSIVPPFLCRIAVPIPFPRVIASLNRRTRSIHPATTYRLLVNERRRLSQQHNRSHPPCYARNPDGAYALLMKLMMLTRHPVVLSIVMTESKLKIPSNEGDT